MAAKRNKFDIVSTITNQDLYAKNVYLIGTAELGPTNKPVLIANEGQLKKVFGTKGSLIQGYKEVREGSQDCNIFLVKSTGTHSLLHLNVNIKGGEIVEDGFIIKAKESHQVYNNIKIMLNTDSIIFQFPEELGGGFKEYFFADYEILGLLAKQINDDTAAGTNCVYAQCMVEQATPIFGSLTTVNPGEMYMYGGNNGLVYYKNQYYYCLNETYSLLEGEPIDIIVPLEAYLDDVHPKFLYYGSDQYNSLFYQEDRDYLSLSKDDKPLSYYEQLLLFCIKQLRFGFITHGVMGFNRTFNKYLYDQSKNYIMEVVRTSLQANRTREDLINYYFLVSAVAGDLYYNYGAAVNNGYTLYAGLISSISISSNSTNKAFKDSVSLFNEFNEEDINELSNLGVVSFRASPLYDRVVVSNGVTTASLNTDLHYFCNVRMIQLTISFVKELFETFIGEDVNALINGNIIESNLTRLLDFLKDRNILSDYKKQIVKNEESGSITLYLDLKTLYMVEYIRTVGGVSYEVQ